MGIILADVKPLLNKSRDINLLNHKKDVFLSTNRPSVITLMFSPPQLKQSFLVSVFVGSLLNVINQWSVISGPDQLSWLSLFANYAVPFLLTAFLTAVASIQVHLAMTADVAVAADSHSDNDNKGLLDEALNCAKTITQNASNVNQASKAQLVFVEDVAKTARRASDVSKGLVKDAQNSEQKLIQMDDSFNRVCQNITSLGQHIGESAMASGELSQVLNGLTNYGDIRSNQLVSA
jgi:hypothetical protein